MDDGAQAPHNATEAMVERIRDANDRALKSWPTREYVSYPFVVSRPASNEVRVVDNVVVGQCRALGLPSGALKIIWPPITEPTLVYWMFVGSSGWTFFSIFDNFSRSSSVPIFVTSEYFHAPLKRLLLCGKSYGKTRSS